MVHRGSSSTVQWSSGYDFCLTTVRDTEGLQFDPGLDHLFFLLFTTMINIPQLALDTYIALGLVIATPWLYYLFSSVSKSTKDQALSLLLLIHTLYTLHALLVAQPPNVFKSLDLPPNIPPDYLREKLLERLGQDVALPLYLDTLLKRLGLLDFRSLYFRYVIRRVFFFCSWLKMYHSSLVIVLDIMSLRPVYIVNHSMILLFMLFLHRCWNIFERLDLLGYGCFLYHSSFDSNAIWSLRSLHFQRRPKRTSAPLALVP